MKHNETLVDVLKEYFYNLVTERNDLREKVKKLKKKNKELEKKLRN